MSTDPGAPWVTIAELSAAVGPSERQIHKFKSQGILRPGFHYYSVGEKGGQLFFSVPRVRETLLELTAERSQHRRPETYDEHHSEQLSQGHAPPHHAREGKR